MIKKLKVAINIHRRKILEFCRFDSYIITSMISILYLFKVMLTTILRNYIDLSILVRMYKRSKLQLFRNLATSVLQLYIKRNGINSVANFFITRNSLNSSHLLNLKESILENRMNMFDKRLLILSVPEHNQKGVLIVGFNFGIGNFTQLFDIKKIANKYVLIVEPSTTGFLDTDILSLTSNDMHVIVQTFEEKIDGSFLTQLNTNLIPTSCAANQWVDTRIFFPIFTNKKTYDLISIGLWNDVKRHYELFESMKRARKKIKVALIGIPWEKTIDYIKEQADYFGVKEQIDFFENQSPQMVNTLLNASKFCILMSKKEGSNRAVIESLFANTPILIRRGINYGYDYPFINGQTGLMYDHANLHNLINSIDTILINNSFSPSKWANNNISFKISTSKLINTLKSVELKHNILINKNIEFKVNIPEFEYFDITIWKRFANHYNDLKLFLK